MSSSRRISVAICSLSWFQPKQCPLPFFPAKCKAWMKVKVLFVHALHSFCYLLFGQLAIGGMYCMYADPDPSSFFELHTSRWQCGPMPSGTQTSAPRHRVLHRRMIPFQPNSDFSPLSPGVAHWRLYSALAGFAPVESKAHQAQISRASHRSFTVATFTDRTPLHVALSLSLHTFLLLLLIAREKIGPKWRVSSKNNLEREREGIAIDFNRNC
jgi:hypothetical protein